MQFGGLPTMFEKRHEALGDVRRFLWAHRGREPIIVEAETSSPNCIQMLFGAEFNFQRSGFHGEWFVLNRTTIFVRGLRYQGVRAQWTHNLIFLRVASAVATTYRCTTFPITITELAETLPSSWGRLSSLEDISSGAAADVWREYISSSGSSSSATTSSGSSTPSESSSTSFNSWTWENYINRTI